MKKNQSDKQEPNYKPYLWGLILLIVIFSFVYVTFIQGNNFGHSFIEELRNGSINSKDVIKLEILDIKDINLPFEESEYRKLKRSNIITKRVDIDKFIKILKASSIKGYAYQNHPVTIYRSFIKVAMSDNSFYYLYVTFTLSKHLVINVNANSKNSTNPNGATMYYNNKIKFLILKYDSKNIDNSI